MIDLQINLGDHKIESSKTIELSCIIIIMVKCSCMRGDYYVIDSIQRCMTLESDFVLQDWNVNGFAINS